MQKALILTANSHSRRRLTQRLSNWVASSCSLCIQWVTTCQSTCRRHRAFMRALDCITCVCSCVRVACVRSQELTLTKLRY